MSSLVKPKRNERCGMSCSISELDHNLWFQNFQRKSKSTEVDIQMDLHGLSQEKLEKGFISGTVDSMNQGKTGCVKEL